MVRVFAFIPKVKGSNLMGGVVCGQQWYVDRIFSYQICRNPTLAKCGGEAQHSQKLGTWSPLGFPNV
jgi:hypothetical protein